MRRRLLFVGLVLIFALLAGYPAPRPATDRPAVAPRHPTLDFGQWPLAFEENTGQAAAPARFLAHGAGGTLYFTAGAVMLVPSAPAPPRQGGAPGARLAAPVEEATAPAAAAPVQIQFLAANPAPTLTAGEPLPGQVNYLVGSDPAGWRVGLPTFARLTYRDLYPGVDLAYSGMAGQLKGTYTVAPGADPARIRWRYQCGVRNANCGMTLDTAGNLRIDTRASTLIEQAPVAWQLVGGQQVPVAARYALVADGSIGFALGAYDPAYPLIIDPTLVYMALVQASNFAPVTALVVDNTGNTYLTGMVGGSNLPLVNPFQPTFGGGGEDAFVAKLNPDGSAFLYTTYLGGSDFDLGLGIAVDSLGRATVVGQTGSLNFPLANALQPQFGGPPADAFVTQLNPLGNALVYSTYLGGSGNETAYAVTQDDANNTYLTGETGSATDFPLVHPVQAQYGGGQYDAFVAKLSPGGATLLYSTFLGGNGGGSAGDGDRGQSIAVNGAGQTTVTGRTNSTNFPLAGPLQPTYGGGAYDAFITRLTPAGTALVYSTYLGGGGDESGGGVVVDTAERAYVSGWTSSTNFPVVNAFQPQYGGGAADAFVAHLNPGGTVLDYATFLGGSGSDGLYQYTFGPTLARDAAGNIYVSGTTASANFPLVDPLPYGRRGPSDVFVSKFNPAGSALLYSTYLGWSETDRSYATAADGAGNVYVGGSFENGSPATAGGERPTTLEQGFIVRIHDLPVTTPTPTVTGTPPTVTPTATGTPPCPPPSTAQGTVTCYLPGTTLAYTFIVTSTATTPLWTWGTVYLELAPGPGGPWTAAQQHTLPVVFRQPGTYTFGNNFYLAQPLPGGTWFHARLDLTTTDQCWSIEVFTAAQPACSLLTPTPPPTVGPTGTATPPPARRPRRALQEPPRPP